MTAQRWRHLKSLFGRVVERPPEQQRAIISQVRKSDPDLGADLSALIHAHQEQTGSASTSFKFHVTSLEPRLFAEGEIILGRFQILRFLGAGGMGEVYEANDLEMGRIALKTIRQDISSSPQTLQRLKREAQLARAISSPHVCRIYELFLVPPQDGKLPAAFLTMEFIEGCTLADRIQKNGAISWREAEKLAMQICSGLQAIHEAGVVHRDLKSRNIMLTGASGSRAVVMDFGLARRTLARGASAESRITQSNSIVGTPEYMAPEQFEGGDITSATDIYALGIVLYEMVTGKHPFEAPSPLAAIVRRARHLEPVSRSHSGVPHCWDEAIERCLEYEPSRRYQSAAEVAAVLRHPAFSRLMLPARAIHLSGIRMRIAVLVLLFCLGTVIGLLQLRPGPYRPGDKALEWYNRGIESIHEGTYLKATSQLQKALEDDRDYALTYARLAEAWAELDFRGLAEHELVLGSSPLLLNRLAPVDRERFEAIRATLAGSWDTAIRDYKHILSILPGKGKNERAAGYLDLGRAYERAGNTNEALKDYQIAAQLSDSLPSPWIRMGILKGRRGETQAAEQDFLKAEALYTANLDDEGIAEVYYQRGYAASLEGRLEQARDYIQKSLATAEHIGSGQLEIRAKTRLSVIAYGEGKDDEAIQLATEAIQKAQENHLDYWAIDALIRRANAYIDRDQYSEADADLQKALRQAKEAQRPRLEALANWSLASLRNQQGNAAATASYAQAALSYYKEQGFFNESLSASLLIGRAQLDQGDPEAAARAASDALKLAQKSSNPAVRYPLEELAANAYLDLEHFTDALQHAENALDASRQAGQQSDYQHIHRANALWHLGRYQEAKADLDAITSAGKKRPELAYDWNRIQAEIWLSRRDFAKSLEYAQLASALAKNLRPATVIEADGLAAVTYSQLGNVRRVRELCQHALALVNQQHNPMALARLNLAIALAYTNLRLQPEPQSAANSAYEFFSRSRQKESEWQALLCLARIFALTGDRTSAKEFAIKGIDVFPELEHNLGTANYELYLQRPDVATAQRELQVLAGR